MGLDLTRYIENAARSTPSRRAASPRVVPGGDPRRPAFRRAGRLADLLDDALSAAAQDRLYLATARHSAGLAALARVHTAVATQLGQSSRPTSSGTGRPSHPSRAA